MNPGASNNVLTSPLGADELMRLVPHRPPFFFLRRLLEWSPGRRAVSEVEFDGSEDFFRGHFPGRPVVPGVILVEAAAQTAGLALAEQVKDSPSVAGVLPALAKVKDFRFREPVAPKELLTIEAIVTNRLGTSGMVETTIRRNGTRVADGELMIALSAAPRS